MKPICKIDCLRIFTFAMFLGFFLAAAIPARAVTKEEENKDVTPEVKAEAVLDKSEITIGEKATFSVIVEADKNTKIDFPVIDSTLISIGFAVKDFGEDKPVKLSKDRVRMKYWYTLDTYTTGSYTIPPIIIRFVPPDGIEDEAKTQQVFLEVKSVMKEGEEAADIKDIKPPIPLKISYKKLIVFAASAFLVLSAAGIGFYVYRKHKSIFMPKTPPVPAYVIALRDLEKARLMPVDTEDMIKEYYTRISGIIRHYIENRFNLHAPERTTEEFLAELSVADYLRKNYKDLLRDFLRHCDMVKFAKYGPSKDEIDGVYATAKNFVEETKEITQPV